MAKKHFLAQLGPTDILVKPGTQIDSTYYRDELLLLPANRANRQKVGVQLASSNQVARCRIQHLETGQATRV